MAKQKVSKTNAVRQLDQNGIPYELMEYNVDDGQIDGVTVAQKTGQPVETVYKTLVTTAGPGKLYVFVIPVAEELNLKEAAKAVKEKKLEMLHVKDLLPTTGYIRGGCSPVGMKKLYPTFIHSAAQELQTIVVSAGKQGLQMKLQPAELMKITRATYSELTQSSND
ncbi:Cys-tRNA(Pro) deacylase [Chungangia koreensis]|uniref:Cys-tRNA(Pro)/Cys-tRNA(Cys) deacylase n=1 Tax=Chungangia koreensis TaxID=752657 RepID=A0ABV8X803_9LACT